MKKKLLTVLIICIGIFSLGTISASAETYGDLTYKISNGEITITGCSSSATSVTILPSINGYPVTSIGNKAFWGHEKLKKIVLPNSVVSIGDGAFAYSDINTVNIPSSVRTIGNSAFYKCGLLSNLTMESGVQTIGDDAFMDCTSLTSVVIHDSVTYIGERAFYNCSIKKINIPGSVEKIGKSAFNSCDLLTELTIEDGVKNIGNGAFYYCTRLTYITIPDSVTSIGNNAFYNTEYYNNSSNWENNVLYADNHLLKANNSISGDYEIRQGTITISDSAFDDCHSLSSITIPGTVKNIGNSAFYYCSGLTSVSIENGVKCIGDSVFDACYNLSSITLPDSITYIGKEVFSETEYYNNSDNWQDNILYINNHLIAATDSVSTSYTINQGTKTIGYGAFEKYYNLSSIIIPDSVTYIGDWAFYNLDNLNSVTIENGVAYIGDSAFFWCENLATITIPYSVTHIGDSAFDCCAALTNVTYNGTKSDWDSIEIGSYNEELLNANIEYITEISKVSVSHSGNQYVANINFSVNEDSATLIVALYGEDNLLIGFASTEVTSHEKQKTVTIPIENSTSRIVNAKVMLWDNFTDLNSLCNSLITDMTDL